VFRYDMSALRDDQIVSVDETAHDRNTADRSHGYSVRGQRSNVKSFFIRGNRFTLEMAMSSRGALSYRIQLGSFDSVDFLEYLALDLVSFLYNNTQLPKMNPYPASESVLLLDNATIHHSDEVRELCADHGVLLVFLPAYSPDYAPVEKLFFNIKSWIRRHRDWVDSLEDDEGWHDGQIRTYVVFGGSVNGSSILWKSM
jgi:hypothetical protein